MIKLRDHMGCRGLVSFRLKPTFMHHGLSKMLSVRTKMKLVQRATISSKRDSSSLRS